MFGKKASPSAPGFCSVCMGAVGSQLPLWTQEGDYPKEDILRVAKREDAGALALMALLGCQVPEVPASGLPIA